MPPFRLLVHGGSSFQERVRFGDWHEVPRAALEDEIGLRLGEATFGVGFLGGRRHLIIRRMQAAEARVYPLTVLVDPPADTWEKFGWNAAHLAEVILAESEGLSAPLLLAAERLTVAELDSFLSQLQPTLGGEPDELLADDVGAVLWAGAVSSPAFVSLAPADFGAGSDVSAAELARLLQRLPTAFRTGCGWLVGGSAWAAQRLGAAAWIGAAERGRDAAEVPTGELVERGRRIFAGLKAVEEAGEATAPQSAWWWEAPLDPQQLEQEVELLLPLGELQLGLAEGGAWIPAGLVQAVLAGPFATAARKCMFDCVMHSEAAIPPGIQDAALGFWIDRTHHIQRAQLAQFLARFDPAEVGRRVAGKGRDCVEEYAADLPSVALVAAWERLIADSPEHARLEVLSEALDRLEEALAGQASLEGLIPGVFGSLGVTTDNLEHWFQLGEKHPGYAGQIRDLIEGSVLKAAQSEGDEGLVLYLASRCDRGGEKLDCRLGGSPAPLVERVLQLAKNSNPDVRRSAEEWLRALASTRLRNRLPVDLKLHIAGVVRSDWSRLEALAAYVQGNPTRLIPAKQADAAVLNQELTELLRQHSSRGNPAPNLTAILKLVPDVGPEARDTLRLLKPARKSGEWRNWVEGLRKLGLSDQAAQEEDRVRSLFDRLFNRRRRRGGRSST